MTGADERRLERYELFANTVYADLEQTERDLARLKEEGRTRSATYQQLFANRMALREIVTRLKDAGL